MKYLRLLRVSGMTALLLIPTGCATSTTTTKVATGALIAGAVGAAVGNQFVHHGEHGQFRTQNTVITSIIFALVTGGFLAWHYQQIAETQVEISGRYSRYRLCNPDEMTPELAKQLQLGGEEKGATYSILPNQIGKNAISLDDNTKWAYPSFRKRYLQPERGELQVLSTRYIWEIMKPGSFVTRTQNPEYFFEGEEKK